MLRFLNEAIPELPVPTGYRVRELALSEISDRAAAERDVWLPWTVGNVSTDEYARLMRLPGYHRDLDIVTVTSDGAIAAYVNGWIDPLNRIGDFGPVGARPAYRRQGFTRLALLESLRRGVRHGTGVFPGRNTPALNLYTSLVLRSEPLSRLRKKGLNNSNWLDISSFYPLIHYGSDLRNNRTAKFLVISGKCILPGQFHLDVF
jgi:GNAT superfamily N-acetyltransferase